MKTVKQVKMKFLGRIGCVYRVTIGSEVIGVFYTLKEAESFAAL